MPFTLISLLSLFLCVLGSGGDGGSRAGGGDDNGMSPAIYAGVAAAGVSTDYWYHRDNCSLETKKDFKSCASANPYELEDGYQAVSRAAAENLQASGSGAEANYAQKPGELDYAELGDLRRELQVPAAPSGAAAAAAVRPPAYGETVYADIAQFGVPQPDPTYANVSKGEVVYSNVESM
ncbi:hypothetical protein OS493_001519 [Desmophyllum pertusum]|uniref:Uncharacterized protein n=1 Tax=Desmophyllum pertusum TaxID=174260 RepID=A0A9W9ZHE2_9CNID|nr:hypothetical protein OS493_001519 [Desmophyllum pertusum]